MVVKTLVIQITERIITVVDQRAKVTMSNVDKEFAIKLYRLFTTEIYDFTLKTYNYLKSDSITIV